MSCYRCICNGCVYSCELAPKYFTVGEIAEIEDVCYDCDSCCEYDGSFGKKYLKKQTCERYVPSQKYFAYKAQAEAEKQKQEENRKKKEFEHRKQMFRVIRGGKV